MKKKTITLHEIWQDKPLRYAVLSLVVAIILAIIAPLFPHLWLVWVAITLIAAIVYFVSTWIITAREQEGV
jgi:hypothetical protein